MLSLLNPAIEAVHSFGHVARALPAVAVPDPAPSAPAGLVEQATTVLSLIKWVSIIVCAGVLMGSGVVLALAENGHGQGLSSRGKQTVGGVVVGLVLVASAAQIVTFLS